MTREDRILAKQALDNRRLSPDQVDQLLAETARTGRPFKEVAIGRGLLSPQDLELAVPKQLPTAIVLLIFVALMVLTGTALLVTRQLQLKKAPDSTSHERKG